MSLTKRSVVVGGHRTSVSLEFEFWQALARMAAERGISVNALVTEIDRDRHAAAAPPSSESGGLSSALRIAVLRWALAEGDNRE